MAKQKLYWRTDYQIRAPSLRVIDSEGKFIGVLSVNEAVTKAKSQGLSLVEIAPNATPPVAKIVDFGKFRYAEEKKLRSQSKKVKGGEVKEIRFSPFIAENDFKTRIERIKEFFNDKNKVRVVVVFKGPQMRVKHVGYDVINKIKTEFGESVITDMEPKFLGKHLITVISQTTKKKAVGDKKDDKNEDPKVANK
ncbi:MAG TPA: translation initiation factor IF-3 [Patescibacteria group bacterium]|nr:translation initiation factor IF-3 [Patescibacteria group bacterium]